MEIIPDATNPDWREQDFYLEADEQQRIVIDNGLTVFTFLEEHYPKNPCQAMAKAIAQGILNQYKDYPELDHEYWLELMGVIARLIKRKLKECNRDLGPLEKQLSLMGIRL